MKAVGPWGGDEGITSVSSNLYQRPSTTLLHDAV